MGKKIDTFVISAAIAAAFYFYYQHAFHSRTLAVLLALLSFIVLRKTLCMLVGCFSRVGCLQKRRLRRRASALMLELASMPQEEVRNKLAALVEACYGESGTIAVVQNHPSLFIAPEQVFGLWKQHQGSGKLVICATCRCDAACRSLASTLKEPQVAVIDSGSLSQMIAEHPAGFTFRNAPAAHARLRLAHLRDLLLNRKNAPRCLLFCASMLLMYLIGGGLSYLIFSMALLLIALLSLRRPVRPARLF